MQINRKPTKLKSISIIAVLLGIALLSFYIKSIKLSKNIPIICSRLFLPNKEFLLSRTKILQQIENNFKTQIHEIPIVALVGPGGSGKTIISRMYSTKQRLNVIWEIRAENEDSLMSSFDDLAFALATSQDQKQEWLFIQNIQDRLKKAKATLKFVQSILRNMPNWLLIYDNVENFLKAKNYLPRDPNLWGNGKVIITTRNLDTNTPNSPQILIDELGYQESLELFCKILYNTQPELLTHSEQKKVNDFLINLSPFPLDITTAAYYIKGTNINYQEYLQAITSATSNFDMVRLLKETSNYDQSRWGILTLSLKKIIDIHPTFKEMLFFICLIDPQDIPKDLLMFYKDSCLVNDFLYQLQKYSLLIDGSDSFSLHHSIHAMCKAYIATQTISKSESELLIISIGNVLEKYLNEKVDKASNTHLLRLTRHGEAFLRTELTRDITSAIELTMGRVYYELNDIAKAQQLLEHGLKELVNGSNPQRSGKAAIHLGLLYYYKLGDFKRGQKYLEQGVKFYSQEQYTTLELARSLTYLGRLLLDAKQYPEAKEKLEQSINLLSKETEASVALAHAKLYLGMLYSDLADYDAAFKLFSQSLELYKILNIERDVGWVFHARGISETERGNYKEAYYLLRQSGKIFKKVYKKHHLSLWWHYLYFANLHRDMGNYPRAKKYYDRVRQIYESYNLDNKAKLGLFLLHVGKFYTKTGNYMLAKENLEKSRNLYVMVYGENSLKIASILVALWQLNIELGAYRQARYMLTSGLSLLKQHLHANHPKIRETLISLEIANKHISTGTK